MFSCGREIRKIFPEADDKQQPFFLNSSQTGYLIIIVNKKELWFGLVTSENRFMESPIPEST